MQLLKADTQVKVRIGPFVDSTDGVTPETGVTLGGADQAELLKHDGAATVNIAGNTWAAIAGCDGWYDLTLTTTDTNTEGLTTVVVQDSSVCCPVFAHFMVRNANVYDSLSAAAATDYLQVDAVEISGDSTAADNCEADYDGTGYVGGTIVKQADVTKIGGAAQSATDLKDFADAGYDPATNKVQGVVLADTVTTLTGHTVQTGDSYARLGAPAGASVSADIAAIEAQTDDIGVAGAGLTAVPWNSAWDTEVESECADALIANNLDHLCKTVTASADMTTEVVDNTILSRMLASGDTSAFDPTTDSLQDIRDKETTIETDTNELQADLTNGGRLDLLIDAIKAQTDQQPAGIPKGVELANFTFFMVLASDHITPATSKTIVEEISKDGGAFAACTNAFGEIGNGFYKITLTAAEMNAAVIALKFTETDCDQTSITLVTSV